MSDTSGTTSPILPSTNIDYDGLTPTTTENLPILPPLLPSDYPRLVSVVHRYPLLSTTLLYVFLVGGIAGATKSSYNWGKPGYNLTPPPDFGVDRPLNVSRIELLGRRYREDLANQKMTIGWTIGGCGEYSLDASGRCWLCGVAVDVYIDDTFRPIFSYDPVHSLPDPEPGWIYYNAGGFFKIDHDLDAHTWDLAPFDVYSFDLNLFAIEKATNKSLDIYASLFGGGGVSGFNFLSIEKRIETTRITELEIGRTIVGVKSSWLSTVVKRSWLVKAFTVLLLITNSALSICSAYVTLLAVTRREKMNDAVLFFPVTAILTIPALRYLYPGSPPFDTFGFFLQMTTVALCSMVLLYVVTIPSTPHRRAPRNNGNTSSPGVDGYELA